MAKMEKKSVSELLAVKPKKPSIEEIEQITQNIHTQKLAANNEGGSGAVASAAPKVEAKPIVAQQAPTPEMDELGDRIKRISVHASIPLYLKAKTKSTIQGVSMMAYILNLMENDLKG
jgi:hypothetical protein